MVSDELASLLHRIVLSVNLVLHGRLSQSGAHYHGTLGLLKNRRDKVGVWWEGGSRGGNIHVLTVDSGCCMADTSTTL